MAKINLNTLTNWQDGQIIHAADYKQEREIIVVAINDCDDDASSAQTTANTALANAATAQTTANTAVTNAATAQNTANTALANASNAQNTANTALTNAATAQSGVNTLTTSKADKTYVDAQLATKADFNDMTNALSLKSDKADTYTKSQTDQKISEAIQGLDMKDSVLVATTSSIPQTVVSGNTLSFSMSESDLAIYHFDGYFLGSSVGSRVLIKNQANATENGFYVLTSYTSQTATWVFTRVDLLAGNPIQKGVFVVTERGNTQADKMWVLTSDFGTVGTSNITFQQLPGAGAVTAGTGIIVNNQQVSVDTNTIATVSALNTGLSGKANTVHTHAIADVASLQTTLNQKANINNVYTKTETIDQIYTYANTTTSLFEDVTLNGATAYADGVKPLSDPAKREGWYFKNDWTSGTSHLTTANFPQYTQNQLDTIAKRKINWYFFSPSATPTIYGDFYFAYAIVTVDSTGTPFFYAYVGTNPLVPNATVLYSTKNTSTVAGKTYLFWFKNHTNAVPSPPASLFPALPRIELTHTSTTGVLDNLEPLITIAYSTASGANQNSVQLQTYELGHKSATYYQRYDLQISSNADQVATVSDLQDIQILSIMGVY